MSYYIGCPEYLESLKYWNSPTMQAKIQAQLDAVIRHPNIKYSWDENKVSIQLLEKRIKQLESVARNNQFDANDILGFGS